MTHMVRKQIQISRRQQALLKRLAGARGVSEAEVVRQAIDREVGDAQPEQVISEQGAMERLIQAALQRRELGVTGEPYQWQRADAYDERMRRFDHFGSDSSTQDGQH